MRVFPGRDMSPLGLRYLGELLSTIDRHSVPVEVKHNFVADRAIFIRKARPLEKWKPSKRAKFERMERHLKKLRGGGDE